MQKAGESQRKPTRGSKFEVKVSIKAGYETRRETTLFGIYHSRIETPDYLQTFGSDQGSIEESDAGQGFVNEPGKSLKSSSEL